MSRLGVEGAGPAIPDDLSGAYHEALSRLPNVVEQFARRPLGEPEVRAVAAALALANGQPALSMARLHLGAAALETFPDWIARL